MPTHGCHKDAIRMPHTGGGQLQREPKVTIKKPDDVDNSDSMVFSTMQVYLTLKILPNPRYVAESLVLKTASVDYTCVEE
jgi:hypothetical protein